MCLIDERWTIECVTCEGVFGSLFDYSQQTDTHAHTHTLCNVQFPLWMLNSTNETESKIANWFMSKLAKTPALHCFEIECWVWEHPKPLLKWEYRVEKLKMWMINISFLYWITVLQFVGSIWLRESFARKEKPNKNETFRWNTKRRNMFRSTLESAGYEIPKTFQNNVFFF